MRRRQTTIELNTALLTRNAFEIAALKSNIKSLDTEHRAAMGDEMVDSIIATAHDAIAAKRDALAKEMAHYSRECAESARVSKLFDNSDYIGTKGEIVELTVRYEDCFEYRSKRTGYAMCCHQISVGDNLLVCHMLTSAFPELAQIGATIRVRAKIAGHSEYEGTKQTSLFDLQRIK